MTGLDDRVPWEIAYHARLREEQERRGGRQLEGAIDRLRRAGVPGDVLRKIVRARLEQGFPDPLDLQVLIELDVGNWIADDTDRAESAVEAEQGWTLAQRVDALQRKGFSTERVLAQKLGVSRRQVRKVLAGQVRSQVRVP